MYLFNFQLFTFQFFSFLQFQFPSAFNEKKSKKYIRLIEPNKVVGRDPKYNKKNKEGGHIAMSQKDFEDNCCSMGQTINHT